MNPQEIAHAVRTVELMIESKNFHGNPEPQSAEITNLRTQVAALTKERDRYEKALVEWEDREAKVCPENVSFESVIAAITKEGDQAEAACAVMHGVFKEALKITEESDWPFVPMVQLLTKAISNPNPGQPLLDRFHAAESGWRTMQEKCERLEAQFAELSTHTHALEQGVKVAVDALDSICSQDYLTSGDPNDHPVAIASDALGNLKHLTPLLTTSTKDVL